MPHNTPWSDEDIDRLRQRLTDDPTLTGTQLAPEFSRYSWGSVKWQIHKLRAGIETRPKPVPPAHKAEETPELSSLAADILEQTKRHPKTIDELADQFDRGPGTIRTAVGELHEHHYRIEIKPDAVVGLVEQEASGYTPIPLDHFLDGDRFRIGLVSDTHLGSIYAREDVLDAAYDFFEYQGISTVLHSGNWIDGYKENLNGAEINTPPTFEAQTEYFVERYPKRPGIVTHILSGDDHEGWWAKSTGLDVGKRMEQTAREHDRDDLINLGYAECDIPFMAEGGKKPAMLRIVHPGGGSSYAISYFSQRLVESYSGGEKPQILLIGHLHKAEFLPYRNTMIVQSGCLQDQTLFMRKKKLAAHVGFWVLDFQVSTMGEVTSFMPCWKPFFDEGYYRSRYGFEKPSRVG